jgi:L-aminopeptidase/D-esterase-like protein
VKLSASARIALVLLATVGVLAYAIVVDLGVNAGRIHHGVWVDGVEVGGLTEAEAVEELKRRETEILSGSAVAFGLKDSDFTYLITARRAGWTPATGDAAAAAMRVGRDGAPFGALADRLRGYLGGVKIQWGSTNADRVTAVLDDLESRLADRGLVLDRAKMRYKIRRAIFRPQRTWRIPLAEQ